MLALPEPLSHLSIEQLLDPTTDVWQKIESHPVVVFVDECGSLSFTSSFTPMTRWDAYCLQRDQFSNSQSILSAATEFEPVEWELVMAYEDFLSAIYDEWEEAQIDDEDEYEDGASESANGAKPPDRKPVELPSRNPADWPDSPEPQDLKRFVKELSPEEYALLRKRMEEWADEPALPGTQEEDYFIDQLANPQESVLRFFRDHVDKPIWKHIGVVITEAEHPGSTYYAAEIKLDPDEATRRAIEVGLPVRFVPTNSLSI